LESQETRTLTKCNRKAKNVNSYEERQRCRSEEADNGNYQGSHEDVEKVERSY